VITVFQKTVYLKQELLDFHNLDQPKV